MTETYLKHSKKNTRSVYIALEHLQSTFQFAFFLTTTFMRQDKCTRSAVVTTARVMYNIVLEGGRYQIEITAISGIYIYT